MLLMIDLPRQIGHYLVSRTVLRSHVQSFNEMNQNFDEKRLNTSVLFIVFNKLEQSKKVFQQIRKAKPPRIYISSDGPRRNVASDSLRVEEVRHYLINNIDWGCEVKTLFREENAGCKYAVGNAISWFFEHEDMGIILEDDCLPSHSFFMFCEQLLIKYRHDERIGMISGRNNLGNYKNGDASYLFATGGSIWGWATWKRVVKTFDVDHTLLLDKNLPAYLYNSLLDKRAAAFFGRCAALSVSGHIDTWDYQWGVLNKINSRLAIVPVKNLICNIGFCAEATHTSKAGGLSELKNNDLTFPLVHPPFIVADQRFSGKDNAMQLPSRFSWIKRVIKRVPGLCYIWGRHKRC